MSFFDMFVEYAPLFIEASWVTLRLTAVALAIAVSATMSGRADLTTQLRRGEER